MMNEDKNAIAEKQKLNCYVIDPQFYPDFSVVFRGKHHYFESVKATLDHLGEAVAEFDEQLWCNLLDHMVVNDEERVTVIFRDGMEIVVPLGDLVKSRTRTASRKKPTS